MTIPAKCQALAQDLDRKQVLWEHLRDQYAEASGIQKTYLLYEVREAAAQITEARRQLEACVNSTLPDLLPVDISIRWHANKSAFDLAVRVRNQGGGAASGPFKIAFDVEYYTYDQDPPLRVDVIDRINVPDYIWIEPGDTITSEYYSFIPFVTRKGQSTASYTFWVLVDEDDQVAESAKLNNSQQFSRLLKPPLIVVPPLDPPVMR